MICFNLCVYLCVMYFFKIVCCLELYFFFDIDISDRFGSGVYVENYNVLVVQGVVYFNGEVELVIFRFVNFEYNEIVVVFNYLEIFLS